MRRALLVSFLLLLLPWALFCSVADPSQMTDLEILTELENNSKLLSLKLNEAESKVQQLQESLTTARSSLTLSQQSLTTAQTLLTEQAKTLEMQQTSLTGLSSSLQNLRNDIRTQTRLNWAITITTGVSISLLVVLLIIR